MKKALLFLSFFLLGDLAISQNGPRRPKDETPIHPVQENGPIQRYYNSPYFEQARWIRPLIGGGYSLVGVQKRNNQNLALLIEVDEKGKLKLGKIYQSPNGYTELIQTVSTPYGTFSVGKVVLGTASRAVCIMTDKDGDILWQKQYAHNRSSTAFGCNLLSNGDLLFYGDTDVWNNLFVFRLTASGDVVWSRRYTTSNNNVHIASRPIIESENGDLIVGGAIFRNKNYDMLFMRLDSANGDVLAQRNYGGPVQEEIDCLFELPNGDIIATGTSYSWGNQNHLDAFAVRFTPNGDIIWMKRGTQSNRFHRFYSSAHLDDGKFVATSTERFGFAGAPSSNLFVFDEDGNLLHDMENNQNATRQDYTISVTSNGKAFAAAGYTPDTLDASDYAVSFIFYPNAGYSSCQETPTALNLMDAILPETSVSAIPMTAAPLIDGDWTPADAGLEEKTLCEPKPTCDRPTDISVVRAPNNAGLLKWTPKGVSEYYEVWYRPQDGISNWIKTTVPYPFEELILPNLMAGQRYELKMRAICGTGNISIWTSIYEFYTVGLTEASISVFPNPAAHTLTIGAPEGAEIRLLNSSSNVVKSLRQQKPEQIFSVSEFTAGLYFVEVRLGDEIVRKKIIILPSVKD